jgi:WD40 repeat protein
VTIHETATGRIVAAVEGGWSGVAFHPVRPVLATGRKWRIILHDVPAGTETDLGPGQEPFCFDPAGRLLAARGEEPAGDRVVIHDLAGGPTRTLSVRGRPLSFTAGGLLVSGQSRLQHWDVAADRPIATTPDGWSFNSVSPDGRWAVLRDKNDQYAVWDLRAGKVERPLPRLNQPCYRESVPFSPTEPLVAYESVTAPRTIELFDFAAGRVRERLVVPGRGQRAMLYGRFRPDGTVLCVEDDYQGDVTLWEVGTGKLLATLPDHNKAHWSPDGRYLVAFCSTGWVDLPGGGRTKGSGSHLRVYEVAPIPGRIRLDRSAERLSFSADGTELAAADTVLRVEEIGGRPRLKWAAQAPEKLTTFFDSAGRRWTFPLGETLKPDTPFTLVQLGPESRTVAFPGRPHRGFKGQPNAGRIAQLVVRPDGRRALLDWDGYQEAKKPEDTSRTPFARLECWDLDGPRLAGLWAEGSGSYDFLSVTFSPDGARAAAVGNDDLRVWDAETGKRITPQYPSGRSGSRSVTFTPDGRHVVVGYDEGWVALLTVQGEKVAERQSHEGEVTALAASPDGRFVVSAADDRVVSVWDPKTLTRLAHWVAADAKITAAAFAPDSRTLAVGDAKGVIQVLDVPAVLDELAGLGFKAKE